jgi:hypothetical protein
MEIEVANNIGAHPVSIQAILVTPKRRGSMHESEPAGVTLKVRFLSLSPTLRRWTGSDPLLR